MLGNPPVGFYGSVIQQIEVLSSKQKDVGAIPTGVTKNLMEKTNVGVTDPTK